MEESEDTEIGIICKLSVSRVISNRFLNNKVFYMDLLVHIYS